MRHYITQDTSRTVALFLNDFDQEYADALEKLSSQLRRKLQGIVLVDSRVLHEGRNTPDTAKVFAQLSCDFDNPAELRRTIKKIENKLLLVTCSSERNQPYLKRLLPHVSALYGPTETSLEWATHKGQMRKLLEAYDEKLIPRVMAIKEYSDVAIHNLIQRLSFPVIIKPTGLAASMLVSKAHNIIELKAMLKSGFRIINDIYERDTGRGQPGFIVEEFIEGEMYSVDAYVDDIGTVMFLPLLRSKTAHSQGKDGFYIYQADSYTTLTAAEKHAGQEAAESAIHALGLRSCVAHVELFKTSHGWKIVELGPRAGGLRQDVYWVAYGIDHALNELRVKIGLKPQLAQEPIAYATTINIYPEQEGIITQIIGYEEALKNPSVYKLKLQAQPGELALLSGNGGKIIIRGVMHNKDLSELEKDAAYVRSILAVHTQPVEVLNA